MTNCTKTVAKFPPLKRREIETDFSGGAITSDGGALLLRQVDKKIKLTQDAAHFFIDPRDSNKTIHSTLSMIRQRVFGIALGYEDLNDHDDLRKDSLIQATVERDRALASSSTLCRFENRANRQAAVELNKLLVEKFISSMGNSLPKELIFDFDATDLPIYGNQEKKAYHGYYNSHCFLPLHVFCGNSLLLSYLRPCNQDPAKHAWAILSLLVKRVRQTWPTMKIVFRADGGFCRHKILQWCDKNKVDYIVGMGTNSRLKKELEPIANKAKQRFETEGVKQKLFSDFSYGAKTWGVTRRIIGKAEHTKLGSNQRFVVTSLLQSGKDLYEKLYCARGDAENRK